MKTSKIIVIINNGVTLRQTGLNIGSSSTALTYRQSSSHNIFALVSYLGLGKPSPLISRKEEVGWANFQEASSGRRLSVFSLPYDNIHNLRARSACGHVSQTGSVPRPEAGSTRAMNKEAESFFSSEWVFSYLKSPVLHRDTV